MAHHRRAIAARKTRDKPSYSSRFKKKISQAQKSAHGTISVHSASYSAPASWDELDNGAGSSGLSHDAPQAIHRSEVQIKEPILNKATHEGNPRKSSSSQSRSKRPTLADLNRVVDKMPTLDLIEPSSGPPQPPERSPPLTCVTIPREK